MGCSISLDGGLPLGVHGMRGDLVIQLFIMRSAGPEDDIEAVVLSIVCGMQRLNIFRAARSG